MASFFTPVSQKPTEAVQWSERAPNADAVTTLLVARYKPKDVAAVTTVQDSPKVAAFDMVGIVFCFKFCISLKSHA